LDTHDHPVIDPVWKLYEHAIRRVGPTATLLEWDDRIPSFDEVHAEARKAEKFVAAPQAERHAGGAMSLLALQKRMAAALMRPLVAGDHIDPQAPVDYIKPNDRLTSLERLEIYSRSYWYRLLDSLYEDFPGLRAVLGQRAFERLAKAYLTDRPSASWTMRNLGSRLEEWLRRNPAFAGDRLDLALDMIRLEWAHIEAFDEKDKAVLGPEDLLELGPAMRIGCSLISGSSSCAIRWTICA
jgi:hypothetical protein